ncbi:D-alanyl-D-alanine carboxypeptidase/D-alanyl-D-alanine endopeptidase [Salinibacillus xinjiangensis]|uniref:D-alanyl-D-alanine carboxypeptidase/D-alanyl-D-alanine-endopeptidase n=1 Tax=Salinibacillus xinjiangensis TaxID=1229268 RepID=A0A6G1X4J0_9BACI|nr:D-alanyl-D-alanine carboxypeptidase/D-alanyl-D-alanine-endopeptidase [Salinibacillus xinjiangensis]MRG85862.1 D-alanyl-D-alanine carboxypeptidase/D-alanyl-D-alanine-endopeptidase [Salinibacillus xinjiangensis]
MKKFLVSGCVLVILGIVILLHISENNQVVQANDDRLAEQFHKILTNEPSLKGAIAGISVRSASTGVILYQHNGDVRLRPASNLKLFTAAIALSKLGKEHTFSTELLTDGAIKNNTLKGNIYIKGKGDPTLRKSDVQKLVSKLKDRGVEKIEGDLVADDTWFDDIRYSQDLPWSDEHTYYGAQVSALTLSPDQDYDAGTVLLKVKPANQVGDRARISVTPTTDYVQIENELNTVSSDSEKDITIDREHGSNQITIKGTIPAGAPIQKEWISVWNPTAYAANVFKQVLKENGVDFEGKITFSKTPKKSKNLATHQSIPLAQLLIPFMKLSNNGHAEVLVKELGKRQKGEGSWEKGLEVIEQELNSFGVNPETLVLRDGSGISHVDLVPANEISQLLFFAQREDWFPVFEKSLPVAGVDGKLAGGTLRYRMNTPPLVGNVKAKTGTLSTVSSLSGYVESISGEKLIFSIILNNLVDEEDGRVIEDEMVRILGNY